jgi:3-oxoacyl-[acyl-carrier protein] reductase
MFHNHLVFITGGASGIGAACVIEFAKNNAQILLNYKNSHDEALELQKQFPQNITLFQGDMSCKKDIKEAFNTAEKIGKTVDILINNAGIINRKTFKDLEKEDFLKILEVNTVGPYLVSKEFASRLKNKQGSIVNIGSLRALQPTPTTIDYAASKAALHNMTISLAKTLAPNIRVNSIAPGFTKTNMHQGNFERLDLEAKKSLLQRYSSAQDIAESVLFFASNKAKSITGQILSVDNGTMLY